MNGKRGQQSTHRKHSVHLSKTRTRNVCNKFLLDQTTTYSWSPNFQTLKLIDLAHLYPTLQSGKEYHTLLSREELFRRSWHSPWLSVFFQKLAVAQLVKKSFTSYGDQRFIKVFTRALPPPPPSPSSPSRVWQKYDNSFFFCNKKCLTLILLMWRIGWAPNNASKWQMGFESAFKGLKCEGKCFCRNSVVMYGNSERDREMAALVGVLELLLQLPPFAKKRNALDSSTSHCSLLYPDYYLA
jgi:hypothetical protein